MSVNTSSIALPGWLEIGVIPILNVLVALFFSGLIMLAIGVNPIEAVGIMINGAFGYDEAIGYTLYYTTNFIFTGLAVAVAFHASLFNIGGEGQAYIGGLGVALVFIALDCLPSRACLTNRHGCRSCMNFWRYLVCRLPVHP